MVGKHTKFATKPSIKKKSFTEQVIASKNNLIHFVTGKDTKNRLDACYYVLVDRDKKEKFKRAVNEDRINLLDYGKIIASCYGKLPNEEVRKTMLEEYDFDVGEDGVGGSAKPA